MHGGLGLGTDTTVPRTEYRAPSTVVALRPMLSSIGVASGRVAVLHTSVVRNTSAAVYCSERDQRVLDLDPHHVHHVELPQPRDELRVRLTRPDQHADG
jgi:hypothetical protein